MSITRVYSFAIQRTSVRPCYLPALLGVTHHSPRGRGPHPCCRRLGLTTCTCILRMYPALCGGTHPNNNFSFPPFYFLPEWPVTRQPSSFYELTASSGTTSRIQAFSTDISRLCGYASSSSYFLACQQVCIFLMTLIEYSSLLQFFT